MYALAADLVSNNDQPNPGWNKLWSLKLPPKAKACVWRVCKGFTPTRGELRRRHIEVDTRCVWCETQVESSWHIFVDCVYARECWLQAGLLDIGEDNALRVDSLEE